MACDDWVLQAANPLPYASCLASVVERIVWPHRAMTAPGAFTTRRGISIRIERLLSKRRDFAVRTGRAPLAFALASFVAVGFAAVHVAPRLALAEPVPELVAEIPPPQAIPSIPSIPHGLDSIRDDDAAALDATGTSRKFVAAMRRCFGSNTSIDDIVGLHVLGIDVAYIDRLRAAGFTSRNLEDFEGLHAMGIDARAIARARAEHYTLTAEDLESLRAVRII